MDVWIEFKNASKWQAEALFRNFFPSTEDDVVDAEPEVRPSTPTSPGTTVPQGSTSSLWSLSPSFASSVASLSSTPLSTPSSPSSSTAASLLATATSMTTAPLPQFGATNQAYLPPPVEERILASHHSAKPLDAVRLGLLAKQFADGVPEEEFSVAALQGCEYYIPSPPYCSIADLSFRPVEKQVST